MKKLNIDVICNDGSPLGVVHADIYGKNGRVGVGGAELALLTMCEGWSKIGHSVRLYNSPSHQNLSPFPQYPIDTFIPQENRDVLIIFRSPNHRIKNAVGKKIWWSCDQYTVGDFSVFSNKVDKIVTISNFHSQYFKSVYGIDGTVSIDLPVRLDDYFPKTHPEKVKHRMIYCSVPDRGLGILAQAYPIIKRHIPDASLVITSDYRLWGLPDGRNEQYIQKFLGMDGVKFLGAIPRMELASEQLLSEIQAYPCTYEELFCYAVAECQVAGAYPVTSSAGAVSTTNMGTQLSGDPNNPHWISEYANSVIQTFANKNLPEMRRDNMSAAIERFSISRILSEWDKVLYE